MRQTNAQRIERRPRKIAALRELASLGIWSARAAVLLKCTEPNITQLARDGGITMPKKPHGTDLQAKIRHLYAEHISPTEIATILGRPVKSIKVLASRMELTKNSPRDPFKWRRGFTVPPELADDYALMMRKRLTCFEAGLGLGLISRPTLEQQLRAEA